jgi:copper(I)-binding protein
VTQIHLSTIVDGVMSMAEADPGILVMDPGASLVLEPGGLHVMCMGLDAALVEGEIADVTLTFETAGDVEVDIDVEQR